MLVCVVGTSTSFTYWGFGVAAHAMREAVGEFHRVHCTTFAEMNEQYRNRENRSVLFTTDLLDEKLSAFIRNSGAAIVALIDTADVAIKTAAKLRRLSCFDAMRHSSLYISSLADILWDKSTTVFSNECLATPVREFVPRFVRAMNISADPNLASRVLARIISPDTSPRAPLVADAVHSTEQHGDLDEVVSNWTDRECAAYAQIAIDYQQILDRPQVRQMTWPSSILYAATPGFHTEKPIDLIGPARLLVWGPYMHLPKGRWTASMEFEVVGARSANSVVADVLTGGEFASIGEFNLPERGVFTWNLSFELTDVTKSVEVRLTLGKSAIEGTFFLRCVRLRPETALVSWRTRLANQARAAL